MNNLYKYTLSSLALHFSTRLSTYKIWFEGEEEVDNVDFEIRFDGPSIIKETGTHYIAGLELDIVAKAPVKDYLIYTKIGDLVNAMAQSIELKDDSSAVLGCFIIDQGNPKVRHYGKLNPSTNLMISVARGTYTIEVSK